jgi:hypothetical protein
MGFLKDLFSFPDEGIALSNFYLPTNQFRLDEWFPYRFLVVASERTVAGAAYVSLQAKEIELVDVSDDDYGTCREQRARIHYRDRCIHKRKFNIGPDEPLLMEGGFRVPKDKGCTITNKLEWEIEVGIAVSHLIRVTFPVMVWPIEVVQMHIPGTVRGGR